MKLAEWAKHVESKPGVYAIGEFLANDPATARPWQKGNRAGVIKSAFVLLLMGTQPQRFELALDDKENVATWKPGVTKGQRIALELSLQVHPGGGQRIKGHNLVVIDP
jgi:hypothetical protein